MGVFSPFFLIIWYIEPGEEKSKEYVKHVEAENKEGQTSSGMNEMKRDARHLMP